MAGFVYIEKRHNIADLQRLSIGIPQVAVHLFDATDIDMAGDDWIRHAGQPTMIKMHIGAADFAVDGFQQSGSRFQHRLRQSLDANRRQGLF